MILDDAFTIDMRGPRPPTRNRSGFRYWIEKVNAPVAPLTRADYRHLETDAILRRLAAAEQARLQADTEDERLQAETAMVELRAVLQERRHEARNWKPLVT